MLSDYSIEQQSNSTLLKDNSLWNGDDSIRNIDNSKGQNDYSVWNYCDSLKLHRMSSCFVAGLLPFQGEELGSWHFTQGVALRYCCNPVGISPGLCNPWLLMFPRTSCRAWSDVVSKTAFDILLQGCDAVLHVFLRSCSKILTSCRIFYDPARFFGALQSFF